MSGGFSEGQYVASFAEELSEGDQTVLTGIVTSHKAKQSVKSAIAFGQKILEEMSYENVMLGITQAGMTNQVRKRTAEVTSALATGSLYDAIFEARQIPAEDKDATFITDVRLLAFVNKIETYLGIELSTSL